MAETDHGSVLRRAMEAVVEGNADAVEGLFTHDVVGWAPNLEVTSSAELSALLHAPDNALSDVSLTFEAIDVMSDKAIVEWRLRATFSAPVLVDEDILVEPTGGPVVLAGVTIAEFSGDKIQSFRCYFDDAALLEQMLVGPST